jgi:NAD(P)-dependent dehydrogenase (short-subunit alcohol dehydrogenase family)
MTTTAPGGPNGTGFDLTGRRALVTGGAGGIGRGGSNALLPAGADVAIDLLVNCHGSATVHDCLDYPDEAWDAEVETNLNSVFFLCRAAGAVMVSRGTARSSTSPRCSATSASCGLRPTPPRRPPSRESRRPVG